MANTVSNRPQLGDVARFGEIRGRLLFLLGALIVYRIGTFIPVPGINPAEVARFFGDRSNTILGIVNMFSGGALVAPVDLRHGRDALHLRLDHHPDDVDGGADAHGAAQGRRVRAGARSPSTPATAPWSLALFQSFAAAGALDKGGMTLDARLAVPAHRHRHHDDRHHVPHVAR